MLVHIVSQNTLRAIRFEQPDYIPIVFWINPACWHHYQPEALFDIMAEHPILFPEFGPQNEPIPEIALWERAGEPYTDAWGCTWETTDDGITGAVTGHPLEDWNALDSFTTPDPAETNGMKKMDWRALKKKVLKAKSKGKYCVGSLEHGHAFQRLSYLRGYENLLLDMADRQPKLWRLIEMVKRFSIGLVQRYLDVGVEMMCYPEDLGMQRGPMLSPGHFHKYIKPVYEYLMAPAIKVGCLTHMHSDGDVRELANDLILTGADVLNLQDLINDVDWIAGNLKGRVCIDLDIDRQHVTRFGNPAQIDDLIREEVEKLGSREGGLMLIYGLYPGVPLENIRAIMGAMERYASYYT